MLFVIDMQNNYLERDIGDMYVPGSEKLISGVIEKIKEHKKKGRQIFYTLDIYTKQEKHLLNINDLKDIKQKESKTSNRERVNIKLHDKLRPYLKEEQYIKKSHYAIPPEELLKLQERFKRNKYIIDEIEFVGVETHICVLSNAVCIRTAFPDANIIINENLTKSIDSKKHKRALEIMKDLGMVIGRG